MMRFQTMRAIFHRLLLVVIVGAIIGCGMGEVSNSEPFSSSQVPDEQPQIEGEPLSQTPANNASGFAEVTDVTASGSPGRYTFNVTVQSPDTGCDQYADWWEVLSEEGELLYRRVLLHSHVNEQPFARSGGPVDIQPSDVVIVRAHMYPSGYGDQAQKGTVEDGFESVTLPEGFATALADEEPQPPDCQY